jgi:alpha-N-arabinofuranosidase
MKPHDTALVDIKPLTSGDTGFHNNLFAQGGTMGTWDRTALPMMMTGNVYLKGTKPSTNETASLLKPEVDPHVKLLNKPDGWYLEVALDKAWRGIPSRQLMTTERLGKTKLFNLPFENPDGSPILIATDYFSKKRNAKNPFPGPLEISKDGTQTMKVWPKQ